MAQEVDLSLEIVEEVAFEIEVDQEQSIEIELLETGPAGVGIPVGGSTSQVLGKASGTDYDTEWIDQTGGGGNMKIGENVIDASPRRALFTDDDGKLTDDVMKSKDISFFGGALTGKAVKPVNFVHDDSMLLGGIDATSFEGTESFGVLQSIDRSGSFAYTKVDFDNLDSVPPETLFLIAYDEATGKSSMFYYPNGIFTDPAPMFAIDETGIVVAGTQKFDKVVTELTDAVDTEIPTAKLLLDTKNALQTEIDTLTTDVGNLQTAVVKRMQLIGTYSFGSDTINFYDGRPSVDIDSYTPSSGEILRVRTAGTKDFGSGFVFAGVNDFIYYDNTEWKTIFNPSKVASFASNALLATGNAEQIQTLNTSTYPDLTELSRIKGVTSPLQTQLDAKKTDSMSTNKLLGRGTAGTGVIEEITLGAGLSLTGNTLNSSGGGSVATDSIWDAKGDIVVATGPDTAVRLPIGFDGQIPIVTSNETTGIRYARPASNHYFSSGSYTPSHAFNSTSGGNQTNGRMFYIPFTVGKRQVFDRSAIYHAAGVSNAGSITKIAIYNQDQTDDKPGPLLHDLGNIPLDTAASSAKELSFSVTLEPGAYWWGIVSQFTGATPSLSGGVASVGMPQGSIPVSSAFFVQNSVSGALPDPAAPNTFVSTAPVIWLRKA